DRTSHFIKPSCRYFALSLSQLDTLPIWPFIFHTKNDDCFDWQSQLFNASLPCLKHFPLVLVAVLFPHPQSLHHRPRSRRRRPSVRRRTTCCTSHSRTIFHISCAALSSWLNTDKFQSF